MSIRHGMEEELQGKKPTMGVSLKDLGRRTAIGNSAESTGTPTDNSTQDPPSESTCPLVLSNASDNYIRIYIRLIYGHITDHIIEMKLRNML